MYINLEDLINFFFEYNKRYMEAVSPFPSYTACEACSAECGNRVLVLTKEDV